MLLFRTEMVKLGPSVVGQPAEKNANDMLKSSRTHDKNVTPAKQPTFRAVIKNGMTEKEMKESGDEWANHKGSYMTLADVIILENEKQSKS
ncbi:hypothetical protein [Spirosoma pollinicola]|uniref:hypothetical protein n=1 Tax=Spirosoma pollinicola TaxID=2057025 RepID=UPI001F0CC667|nr:hypothetical protein [Spirosoma pollinicola]